MPINNTSRNISYILFFAILTTSCVKLAYKTSDPSELGCNIYDVVYYSIDNTVDTGQEKSSHTLTLALTILNNNKCIDTYTADFSKVSLDRFPDAVFPRSTLTFANRCVQVKQHGSNETHTPVKENVYCLNSKVN